MQSRRGVLGAATLLLVLGGIVALVLVRGGSPSAPALVSPKPSTPPPTMAPVRRSSCPTHVAHPFEPVSITVRGVAREIRVVMPPRDSHDVPGVPPLTDTGKRVFAYDREQHVRPGSGRGNVL